MALDIHLSSSQEKAEQLYPELSFGEDLHDLIFDDHNKWIENYPLFVKMNDYYSDCVYPAEEVQGLIQEISEILDKIKDKRCITFLQELVKVCELALKKNENIYCFSD